MSEFLFNGKKIYYEIYGEGLPVLVLNGIMMSTESWRCFKKPLSQNNKLILLDFLDQGKSDKMDCEYKHDLQVEVVEALLEEIGIDKVNIVGISYGSAVGLQFAIKYPQKVMRLVLFNGAARTSKWLAEVGWAWNAAFDLPNGRGYYYTTIPAIYSTKFYEENYAWMQKRAQKLIPYFGILSVKQSLTRLTNSSEGFDATRRLGSVEAKTLIVSSQEDKLIPEYEQRILHEGIKNSQLVLLPNCGHATMYEAPMIFCALCLGWINTADEDFSKILA